MQDESFFDKCKTCKHCYTRQDDDYVYCRIQSGECKYEPYKNKKAKESKHDG